MPPEESPEAKFDRLKKQLQDSILRDYPNPERKGCPGGKVLQQLAESPLEQAVDAHPDWNHVTHCSECYREFVAVNKEFRRKLKARRTSVAWGVTATAAVTAIALIFAITQGGFRFGRPQNAELVFQPRVVDLQGRSITRSGESDQGKPIILRSEPEQLTIRLPFGSEAGMYEVQLLKTADQPLSATTGNAAIEDSTTTLIANVDLSKLAKGTYFLGIRKVPSDWTYYPVQIR